MPMLGCALRNYVSVFGVVGCLANVFVDDRRLHVPIGNVRHWYFNTGPT